ncbi:type II secretion system F family protein [Methylobacterium planeticum]|uniref:Type II secretion system F family protein n=1 Tax=Methylobacterium planeticum TaxID=2615211 RepID=A0A6N6MKW5_9HYPH|nr:type II secretion system F family protein [Methylobacterium planeticum]KAB1070648.1 type II secretion system F family protein [Methylobacterium planeticum]
MGALNVPLAAGLAAVAAGAVAYAVLLPLLSGERRAAQRLKAVSASVSASAARGVTVNRREQVAKTLNEIEAKAKGKKVSLDLKITRAGLNWSTRTYYAVSALLGAALGFVIFALTENPVAGVGALFSGGIGLPLYLLGRLRKRRIAKFIKELPNAVDVIVRGIRSGIPVGDCFRIVSREAEEPVRSEFRNVVEAQALGLSLNEAVGRLFERVPVPEVNFFVIVINIQAQSGGNLSEALGNLSRILRERRKMAGKVQAMSMEAKASGGIIAALPFVVTAITYLSSPDYISLLWTTDIGRMALAGSAIWMMIGVFTMKKMINFDI